MKESILKNEMYCNIAGSTQLLELLKIFILMAIHLEILQLFGSTFKTFTTFGTFITA